MCLGESNTISALPKYRNLAHFDSIHRVLSATQFNFDMDFLYWLEETALGVWVAQSWGYPLVLSTHAVGMSIVVGIVFMINLRLLGFSSAVPFSLLQSLSRIMLAGIVLNIASGLALFCGNPVKFFFHPVFWTKISLIILGGLSLWWALSVSRERSSNSNTLIISNKGKALAALSLALWLGAIIAGRLIAYFKLF